MFIFVLINFLLTIIWIIDILNIDFIINGIHIAQWLDVTVPLNGWFWFLLWMFMPSISISKSKEEK